ncbi:MAG: hypothetical protein KDC35_12930 [Acidobacteria bacterium]|nr:hypothetical protein [Acidobacteriota bacterium]
MIFKELLLKVEPGGNARIHPTHQERGYVKYPFSCTVLADKGSDPESEQPEDSQDN